MVTEAGAEDQTILNTLVSYVPTMVARRLSQNGGTIPLPFGESFPAAVLFTDISGFTSIAESLAHHGPTGAEELSRLLNEHFGELIDLVHLYGGDVVKFAGDALLAIWQVENANPPQDLSAAVLRAAQCALAIQATMHDHEPIAGARLSLRVGLSAGEVSVYHVGGAWGRYELLISGDPLIQVSHAEQAARPGQVALSQAAWNLIKDNCDTGPLDPPRGIYLLRSIRVPLYVYPVPPVPLYPQMGAGLRAYIPGAILARLAAGQSDWVAELRRVTVLFINLPDLGLSTSLEQAQHTMLTLQSAIYRYEGSINKLTVDNKGITLVAAFGLPPISHEDDPLLGAQAAQALLADLDAMNLRCTVGVATGRSFCGAVGNALRREYTMVGDVVNLAARLMQAARHEVICDAATYQAACKRLDFETLHSLNLKGVTQPVTAYRPKGTVKAMARPRTELIGRHEERSLLIGHLQTLLRAASRQVVIIEGEAGIGKSRLVEELLRQANLLSVFSLVGGGDSIEKSTPYHAWRPVLSQFLGLDLSADLETRRQQVWEKLSRLGQKEDSKRILSLAPLLNAVLPLEFPENDITSQISGEVRAANTRELLVTLLQAAADDAPLLLVLEDAHWFDSASWALARTVSQQVQPLLLVLTTRPLDEHAPPEYEQFLNDPSTHRLRLDTLSRGHTLSLVCQRLGVTSLPEQVVDFIYEKAEGHPFFTEELAYALRDAGLLQIAHGVCRLAPQANDLRSLNFPYTIHGVIVSRIDRLTPQQQLALKVASVIGRVFAYLTLRDIYPVEEDKNCLPDCLSALEKLDLTALASPEPELAYLFKHIITQEVVYDLMLYAQRKQLHQAVAEWYESRHADDLAPYYPLLVHHWRKAENHARTIYYLEKAGEQALLSNANQEAVDFFSQALELAEQLGEQLGISQLQQARWERLLGQAHYGLGQMIESRRYLQKALKRLGWPLPETQGRLILGIAANLLRQASRRFLPFFWLGRRRDKEVYLEAARACAQMGSVLYLSNETLAILHATLATVNLAERFGPSPELTQAYINISQALGLVPLHPAARLYDRLAWQSAQQIGRLYETGYLSEVNGLYYAGLAQWDLLEERMNRAVQIFDQLGDRGRWGESMTILAVGIGFAGDFARSTALLAEVGRAAERYNNPLQQAWSLVGRAEDKLRLGKAAEAEKLLDRVLELLATNTDRSEEVRCHGLLALARLRQGKQIQARRSADTVMRLIHASMPTVFSMLVGYAAAAEVYLRLWEIKQQTRPHSGPGKRSAEAELTELGRAARAACQALAGFARIFPLGRPRRFLYHGCLLWLAGHRRQAQAAWRKALAEATRLRMPYDRALALYQIGIHLDPADPQRMVSLQQAEQYFAQAGITYELDLVRQAMQP